ncbi:MAG: hypothetical protein LBF02_02895 [Mycoplasmataceae bacterium]|nr:hypothetical protein [Mycoplasmataceae bacterium]
MKNRLNLNKSNLRVTNNGFFKPIFFKFCWSQNKTFIIIFSILFLLLSLLIPIISYITCRRMGWTDVNAKMLYIRIFDLIFSIGSILYIFLLFILYGRFITNMVERGDLAYILCSRTSRKQIFMTFLIHFFTIYFTLLLILCTISFILLGFKEENVLVYVNNEDYIDPNDDSSASGANPLDPSTWKMIPKIEKMSLISYWFVAFIQQFTISIVLMSIAVFFSAYCNKLNKYFLFVGAFYIFFYLFNVLEHFGTINQSLEWMGNFKYFTILTLTGENFYTTPYISTIVSSHNFPSLNKYTTIIVGSLHFDTIKIIIVDSFLLGISLLTFIFAERIFIKKDLPI